jgi:competence protein ComEC
MAILVIVARLTGRTSEMVRLLFLAGFLMLLWNPLILLHDPSFQLSFVATLGLLVFAPIISEKLSFIPEKYFLRETASATIATQIFVLPLLLFLMGEISLVAVPVNLLVLLFIPITMFFGFFAGLVGFVSTALALPLAYVSYLFLSYILGVVEFFGSFSFASVTANYFPFWALVLTYGIYATVFWVLYKKQEEDLQTRKSE